MTSDKKKIKHILDKHQKYAECIRDGIVDGTKEGVNEGIIKGTKKAAWGVLKEEGLAKGIMNIGGINIDMPIKPIVESAINLDIVNGTRDIIENGVKQYLGRFIRSVIHDFPGQIPDLATMVDLIRQRQQEIAEGISRKILNNPLYSGIVAGLKTAVAEGFDRNIQILSTKFQEQEEGGDRENGEESQELEKKRDLNEVEEDVKNPIKAAVAKVVEELVYNIMSQINRRSLLNLKTKQKVKLEEKLKELTEQQLEKRLTKSTNLLKKQMTSKCANNIDFITRIDRYLGASTRKLITSLLPSKVLVTTVVVCTVVVTAGVTYAVVPPVNQPPTAGARLEHIEGLTVRFDSQLSDDPDGEIESWYWTFGDGSWSNKQSPTHIYREPGNYTAVLIVTDDKGVESLPKQVATGWLEPVNQPPTAGARLEHIEGLTVRFDSQLSDDPDGEIESWYWTFGDGSWSNKQSPTHIYREPGNYTAVLIVTDDKGVESLPKQVATGWLDEPFLVMSEDLPDELEPGTDIVDMAVSGDGSTIYVAIGTSAIYRSTNGGEGWSSITVLVGTNKLAVDFLAVAPDDPNYVVAIAANSTVYISDDAGANWDSLDQISGTMTTRDIDVSVEKDGDHTVAVAAEDGGAGEIWFYEIGQVSAAWTQATGGAFASATWAGAVAFSPNFYSDQVMVAVTADSDSVDFQVYSYNTDVWNSGAFNNFPEDLQQDTPTTITALDAACIAMAPDYLGSDDSMRIAFVGLAVNGTTNTKTDGIFRLEDDDVKVIRDEKAIHSIAFDGSLLVAGRYDDIDIYSSTNALDSDPSSSNSTGSKEPGGLDQVLVGIAGGTVVAATWGDESEFAYSEDNGNTFNGLSMIDTELDVLSDVAVTPDGSEVYLVSSTNSTPSEMSVWRYAERWERIYNNRTADADDDYIIDTIGSDSDYMVRLAPDDPDVVYLANRGGTQVYFSSSGGMDKWHTRVYRETTGVTDMAVEGDGGTVYVLTTSGYVTKSTNSGFTWGSKKNSKLSGGANTIFSVSEDNLVVGGDGMASYSMDGGQTWNLLSRGGPSGEDVQVIGSSLEEGSFIYLGTKSDCDGIYRWEIGEDNEWDNILDLSQARGYVYGMSLVRGVLYIIGATSSDGFLLRSIDPTADNPHFAAYSKSGAKFNKEPQNLQISRSDSSIKVWTIDTRGSLLYSFGN